MMKEPQRERALRANVSGLCRSVGEIALAAQVALGELDPVKALRILHEKIHDPELLSLADKIEQARKKQDKPQLGMEKPEDPLRYITKVEMLEAQAHGISNETYIHNKTLPLAQRLALPDYEAIYSLNYKEKRNGKRV